ncbi:hypothetical protein RRG08_007356 [Elysia crispata]|uniref:Uncharacterized protein n=1 Tax=Elysia crispata TaxID=231223 RepID=A0AAE1AQQ1_9GAST|nr:hypothetical protein RRG08_007356 [Elysia crispata]
MSPGTRSTSGRKNVDGMMNQTEARSRHRYFILKLLSRFKQRLLGASDTPVTSRVFFKGQEARRYVNGRSRIDTQRGDKDRTRENCREVVVKE